MSDPVLDFPRIARILTISTLRSALDECLSQRDALRAERDLLEQERDTALYDLEREQRAHELHHGGPR